MGKKYLLNIIHLKNMVLDLDTPIINSPEVLTSLKPVETSED